MGWLLLGEGGATSDVKGEGLALCGQHLAKSQALGSKGGILVHFEYLYLGIRYCLLAARESSSLCCGPNLTVSNLDTVACHL